MIRPRSSRTRQLLRETVHACDTLGVDLLVVHAGAAGAQDRGTALRAAAESFRVAVQGAGEVRALAELMAGTSGAVASLPREAEELFAEVGDDRLGLGLDTAHLFAAGVALDDPAGVAALSDELRDESSPRGSRSSTPTTRCSSEVPTGIGMPTSATA